MLNNPKKLNKLKILSKKCYPKLIRLIFKRNWNNLLILGIWGLSLKIKNFKILKL
jgi:hypothetical protein